MLEESTFNHGSFALSSETSLSREAKASELTGHVTGTSLHPFYLLCPTSIKLMVAVNSEPSVMFLV
jgi:hypothetical protein